MDNKRIPLVCANGAGSSLMMKATLQKVLKKRRINPAQARHCSIEDGKAAAAQFDAVFCARNFAPSFFAAKAKGTAIIALKNIMSDKEMEKALMDAALLD